jgi:hypothetical protein
MDQFSTIGIRAVDLRNPCQKWQLVRFEGYMQKDGNWIVRAVSGHNLAPLNRAPLYLSGASFAALRSDYYDDLVRWQELADFFDYSRFIEEWEALWL